MSDVPRLMSTQHPDNATLPFFANSPVVEGDDEIQEAYYAYSHLGCDEQMWDFEGKEGDEYAVKKLLSRYDSYFTKTRLGEDVRLTLRGPNPAVEESEAKILLEILESIPRSYDAAARYAEEYGLAPIAPIYEVIVPMVTDATQVNAVHRYYEAFVAGKTDLEVADGLTVADWVGDFEPGDIGVIPLIETREALLSAHEIVREYADTHDREAVRVFLARSDPALNYGALAADLIDKVALARLYEMADTAGIEIHPILGAGPAPFRGGLAPPRVGRVLDAYPEVETFTIQSAFKYDYPVETVQTALATMRSAALGGPPPGLDRERALAVADRTASVYAEQVAAVAPAVNRLAQYVPDRRARKLHVGLFGYSREVGENHLPRAIGYTAALYSVGCPPSLLGLAGLTDADAEFVEATFPSFFDTLGDAARYYNPRCTELLDLDADRLEAGLEYVRAGRHEGHRAATNDVIDAVQAGDDEAAESAVRRAARERQFLG